MTAIRAGSLLPNLLGNHIRLAIAELLNFFDVGENAFANPEAGHRAEGPARRVEVPSSIDQPTACFLYQIVMATTLPLALESGSSGAGESAVPCQYLGHGFLASTMKQA